MSLSVAGREVWLHLLVAMHCGKQDWREHSAETGPLLSEAERGRSQAWSEEAGAGWEKMQGRKAEQRWCAAAAAGCGGMAGSWPAAVVLTDDYAPPDMAHVVHCASAAVDSDSQLAEAVATAVACPCARELGRGWQDGRGSEACVSAAAATSFARGL